MNVQLKSILLPLCSTEICRNLNRISEAAHFSDGLHSSLRLMIAPVHSVSEIRELESKLDPLLSSQSRVSIETDFRDLVTATFEAVERSNTGLVVLPTQAESDRLDGWQVSLCEHIQIPIVLVPQSAKLGVIQSILVPLHTSQTGEDSVLDYSIQMAKMFDIPVEILHVTQAHATDHAMIDELGDAFYYDYPSRVKEMIVRASPLSSDRDRQVIKKFSHVCGDTVGGIIHCLENHPGGMLALQWKGSFAPGRAKTIKAILRASPCPILLVRSTRAQVSSLQIGDTQIAS